MPATPGTVLTALLLWSTTFTALVMAMENTTAMQPMHGDVTHGDMDNNATHAMAHGTHSPDMATHGSHGGMATDGMDHDLNDGSHDGMATHAPGHDTGMEGTDHGPDHLSAGHGLYFFKSVESIILFREWTTSTWRTMLASCFGVTGIAVAYELLKSFREHLYKTVSRQEKYSPLQSHWSCSSVSLHLFQTVLHMVQVFTSLILMLVFMTFNVWLCIAVVGGAGLGYLIIGWTKRDHSSDEHCH